MNDIMFWYPAPEDDEPFHDSSDIRRKQGSIKIINIRHEPYEITIDTDGYSFHAIFGSQINGHFLCIPNWNIGCELASYNDRYWNIKSIFRSGRVRYEDAYAIGNALQLLEFMLGKDISV